MCNTGSAPAQTKLSYCQTHSGGTESHWNMRQTYRQSHTHPINRHNNFLLSWHDWKVGRKPLIVKWGSDIRGNEEHNRILGWITSLMHCISGAPKLWVWTVYYYKLSAFYSVPKLCPIYVNGHLWLCLWCHTVVGCHSYVFSLLGPLLCVLLSSLTIVCTNPFPTSSLQNIPL